MMRRFPLFRAILFSGLAALPLTPLVPRVAAAQIAPDGSWVTLRTPHFRIHFTRELTPYGRRAALAAERAYANLARELVPPRGVIDVVLTDAVDGSNGSATVFPRNQITVQLRPPVDLSTLESYDDWLTLVLQHETTHIFHLDRTRGLWRVAQGVFGRNPALFPNIYGPSWLTEGLAVYYESKFTEGGRLDGTAQYALARAAARSRALPPLDALSLTNTSYPGGQGTYAFGSFVVNELASKRPGGVRAYIESTSGQIIPLFLDRTAKRTFGETFSSAWRAWRDSAYWTTETGVMPSESWRPLAGGGRFAQYPRWVPGQNRLLYVGDNGRESPALYSISPGGQPQRIARRTSLDANAVGRDGSIVFAQIDFVDRFRARSDLYRTSPTGSTTRLTTGARLSSPDLSGFNGIVAVQTVPGSTRLVLVSQDGRKITPITNGTADTQWAWPRWSPDGVTVAAVRFTNGRNAVVVLDTRDARASHVLYDAPAVVRALAWDPQGHGVYFISDEDGVARAYYAPLTGPVRLAQDPQATVDLTALDVKLGFDTAMASAYLLADGAHLSTWKPIAGPAVAAKPAAAPSANAATPANPYDTAHLSRYRPWRSLFPSYWSPILDGTGSNGTLFGALTSGTDIIGRHSYSMQALMNVDNHRIDASASYRYNRFSRAYLDLSADQTWTYTRLFSHDTLVGSLDRRARLYSARMTIPRVRARTYAAFIVGAELESHVYEVTPDTFATRISDFYRQTHDYPTLLTGIQFTNAQLPARAISPEDGVALSATMRQRWETGVSEGRSLNVVGVSTAYKSLDFPGFAHHVLALRLAGGWADEHSPTRFSIGGINGAPLELLPGFTLGDQNRTFPVRGFTSGTEQGTRAMAASAEYRAPLKSVSRGLGLLPAFLDRTSIALFGDMGHAYCAGAGAPACGAENFGTRTIASAGAELNLDGALQYDFGYRFRAGIAKPVRGGEPTGQTSTKFYLTFGVSF